MTLPTPEEIGLIGTQGRLRIADAKAAGARAAYRMMAQQLRKMVIDEDDADVHMGKNDFDQLIKQLEGEEETK
jgi:uncharacterized protein YjbK